MKSSMQRCEKRFFLVNLKDERAAGDSQLHSMKLHLKLKRFT